MRIVLCIEMPIRGKLQRRAATKLRQDLQDAGYTRLQLNLFVKIIGFREGVNRYISQLEEVLPKECNARIITMTERQYQNIALLRGEKSAQETHVNSSRQLVF
ncbi:MAG: CRISPR-associated endonuclease Cas2 [Coriobacteriia bacterium]|nr:CRISPR-associated endonuclease Cas2 [Coriobacteriia bacterium]